MKKLIGYIALSLFLTMPLQALAKSDKPNILVIMSDDVGVTNISAYSRGLVGYQTKILCAVFDWHPPASKTIMLTRAVCWNTFCR